MRHISSGIVDRRENRARARRVASVVSAVLSTTLAATSALAGPSTPILSSLGWRSGATDGGFPCLAQLRGRTLDVNHIFIIQSTFPAMVSQAGGAWARGTARKAPLWVVSLALLPSGNAGQFDQCATGAFDGYYRQIGANLQADMLFGPGADRRDDTMTDFPRSLPEFERRFPDEAACAEWLLEHRWSRGFACRGAGTTASGGWDGRS